MRVTVLVDNALPGAVLVRTRPAFMVAHDAHTPESDGWSVVDGCLFNSSLWLRRIPATMDPQASLPGTVTGYGFLACRRSRRTRCARNGRRHRSGAPAFLTARATLAPVLALTSSHPLATAATTASSLTLTLRAIPIAPAIDRTLSDGSCSVTFWHDNLLCAVP